MKRDEWQEKRHKKNLKEFIELGRRVEKGSVRIMDIRVETPEFGYQRIIIFTQEKK